MRLAHWRPARGFGPLCLRLQTPPPRSLRALTVRRALFSGTLYIRIVFRVVLIVTRQSDRRRFDRKRGRELGDRHDNTIDVFRG